MKNSKSFRLSAQALEALRYLSSETGANETAVLEMSLAFFRRAYNASKMDELSDVQIPAGMIEKVRVLDPTAKPKKKRKRSR